VSLVWNPVNLAQIHYTLTIVLGARGRGGPRGDRFDDRRGPWGGSWRRDDYRYGRYDSYSDRSRDYGGRDYRDYRRDYRDDYGYRGIDRYASGGGREDRYSREDRRGDDRRGGSGGGYYDRDANPPSYSQGGAPPRDAYASRSYADDRYASR